MNDNNDVIIESGIYNKEEITLDHIINSIKKNPNITQVGSIHTFTGIVRETSKEGKPVIRMKIDAYRELANKTILKICEKLKRKKGIIDVKIIHLKGDFELSEDLVYIVVASAHREEGFDAVIRAVDMYKKEITVWKREDFSNGTSEWVH